jgi:hypothetical protein
MRQGKYVAWVVMCATGLLICGCGKDKEGSQPSSQNATEQSAAGQSAGQASVQGQAPAQPPAASGLASGGIPTAAELSSQAAQTREILTKANQGKDITAVAGDTLKALLPETLAGMKRTSASAEKNQMMGIDMSHAEGQYEGQNDASMSVTITDVGNLSAPMRMGMTAWTMSQYSRETDAGYEKTGTYGGYKGMEEYDKESKVGAIRVSVGDRFIVEIEGNTVTMDTLKQAVEQINLKKIASAASGS